VQEVIWAQYGEFNRAPKNRAYSLTLHINDDKHRSLDVDGNKTILAIDRDDLGCVWTGAVKLRASQVYARRGLDHAFEVNDVKLAGGHEHRTWMYSLIIRISPNRRIGG
jgi:hypothetical protein